MRIPFIAAALALCLPFQPAFAQETEAQMDARIAALDPAALVFVLDADGAELLARNADDPFVPASVAKIVTAWLALEVLGEDHRFETEFYLDADRVLHVRGGGDPFLVSEELAELAPRLLAEIGPAPVEGIVLDARYYPDSLIIPGIEASDEAYDALNAALSVNFNTINAVREGATVRSAEEQTPITPLAIEQFLERGPNGRGRISLPQDDPGVGIRYAGELIAAFLTRAGGAVEGDVTIGTVPVGLEPVYVHRQSRDLAEIVRLMLLGSNNFIANQLFLEVGAHRLGGPASLDKSLSVARELLAEHGLAEEVVLVEGSGISRDNRFTARGLAGVLDLFAPHAALLRRSESGARYKTGTLSDVRTLAGYAETSRNGPVRFVISTRRPGQMRFDLLSAIERGL
ncbi:D-alanyl-D-alanine carboxypeptidase/D-alanyl-D-alanine-endopeptidase [Roseobacter sp. HKCCA0434]|uniref:D-alanyl-D-alanine carboxypeptidase/D-alanyl-D-alanine-endopeptidase n=1 Tax=Roseobacter sp. HKCCA0434 TaxID=3079297 RepID=UPI002905E764|nr:D-alanyl-D-alanine carboxypeptidase [Roseobacter sp. HKCCA0434]